MLLKAVNEKLLLNEQSINLLKKQILFFVPSDL